MKILTNFRPIANVGKGDMGYVVASHVGDQADERLLTRTNEPTRIKYPLGLVMSWTSGWHGRWCPYHQGEYDPESSHVIIRVNTFFSNVVAIR